MKSSSFLPRRGASKKRLTAAAALFAAIQAVRAWLIWLVLAVLIIVVAAIVIYKLSQLIKRKLSPPPPPDPNGHYEPNIVRIWEDHYVDDNLVSSGWVYDNSDTAAAAAGTDPSQSATEGSPADGMFVFQYGLGPDGSMWLSQGQQHDGGVFYDQEYIDEFNYAYSMIGFGVAARIIVQDGIQHSYMLGDGLTNAFSLVIERSVDDLQGWMPIHTNQQCMPYTVETFTDTNAPAQSAFYRTVRILTNP